MDVLTVSMSANPVSPTGGSTMQYFPGTFNGTHFHMAADGVAHFLEFSKDSYAAQLFSSTFEGEDVLLLEWAANLQYTSLVPTAQEGWRGAMTLHKRLFLTNTSQNPAGWNLVTLPVDPSPAFHTSPSALLQRTWNGSAFVELDLSGIASGALYFEIKVTNMRDLLGPLANGSDVGAALPFMLASLMSGEALLGKFLFGLGYAYADRSGPHIFPDPLFVDRLATSVAAPQDGVWKLSVVFDMSMLKVFVNKGAASVTVLMCC